MTSYNKFASIKIGGTYTNTIPRTYNLSAINVSLDCSGNLLTNANSYLQGDTYLGYEYQDPSGNYIDTGGSVIIKLNNVTYTLTPQILSYLSTITSNIQTQINNIIATTGISPSGNNSFSGTNSFSNTTTFTGNISVNGLTISPVELGYLDGVTSNIQTALNGKASLGANTFSTTQTITAGNIQLNSGTIISTGNGGQHIFYKYLDNTKYWFWSTSNTNWGFWNITGSSIFFNGEAGTSAFAGLTSCNGGLSVPVGQTTTIAGTSNLSGTTTISGTTTLSGPLSISGAVTLTGNITAASGLVITPTELSFLDACTSNIQVQLNGKCNTSGFTTTNGSSCFFNASASYPNTTRTHILNELRVVNNTIPTGGFTGNLSATMGNGFLMGWNASGAGGIAHFINSDLGGTGGFRFYNYTNAGVYQTTSLILNRDGTANTPNLLTCDGGLTIPTTKILTLVGNISANSATITPVEISYLDGVTSNIQTQINSISGGASLTANQNFSGNNTFSGDVTFSKIAGSIAINNGATMNFSGGSSLNISSTGFLNVDGVALDSTQLSYIQNLTSDAQTQLDAKANTSATPQLASNNTFTGVNYFNNNDVYMAHPTNVATFRLRSSRPATQIELFPETTSRISLGSSTGNPEIQINETQFINVSVNNVTTIVFPLRKHYIYRGTTTNFAITLPLVTATHEGYSIKIFKTASTALTQIVTINANASNRILQAGSMTELTSSTLILGEGKTNCELAICILQSGIYGWIECDNTILNTTNTWTGSNTFSSLTANASIVANSGITMNGSGDVLTFGSPITNSLTASELYNLKSSSSNIQTQLNDKAGLASTNTFTSLNNFNSRINTSGVEPLTGGELNIGTITTGIINVGNSSTANTFRFNNTIDLLKSTNITGSVTLSFPLSNTYVLRSFTGAITITLPLVTDFHIGKQIHIIRGNASSTNVITLTPNASNRIVEAGTITEQTTNTTILGSGETATTLIASLLESGLYGWIELSNSNKKNSANTYTAVQTFSLIPQLSTQATLDNDMMNYLTLRKNFGGVFMVTLQGSTDIRTAILNSKADLANNLYNQATTSGAHSSPQSGTAVGNFMPGSSLLLKDTSFLIYPKFGLIVYNAVSYGGTITLNFKNTTSNPVFVRGTTQLTARSIKVYFNDVEMT